MLAAGFGVVFTSHSTLVQPRRANLWCLLTWSLGLDADSTPVHLVPATQSCHPSHSLLYILFVSLLLPVAPLFHLREKYLVLPVISA